jgi:AcrR family transcriptional regulator
VVEIGKIQRFTPEMRREQTRAHLLAAAAEVFAAHGFHGAALEEIAETAGFTTGAIYSNFGGKEDLFLAVVQRRQQEMLSEFFAATDGKPDARARIEAITDVYRRLTPTMTEWALWEEFVLYAVRNPELKAKLDSDGKALFAALLTLIEERHRELGIVPPMPVETLARLYLALFEGLTTQRVFDPESVPDDLFATLVSFIDAAVMALGRRRPDEAGHRKRVARKRRPPREQADPQGRSPARA